MKNVTRRWGDERRRNLGDAGAFNAAMPRPRRHEGASQSLQGARGTWLRVVHSGTQLWALTDAEHAGDPNEAVIYRQAGGCFEYETLANPPGPDQETGYRGSDLAVDGTRLYLVVPGTGIVSHGFTPVRACP